MIRLRFPFLCSVIALLLVLITGCAPESSDKGVVARIDGVPVYLSEIRADHDLQYMTWSSANDFNTFSLQREYGIVLANILLQRLLEKTLQAEQLEVSDNDVAQEEALIRSDYPDDQSFEQTLIQEYVDLDQWRKRLRFRLNRKRFIANYLRPKVHIGYEQARDYYRAHRAEFVLPERFVFTVFQGKSRKAVEAALREYQRVGNATLNKGATAVAIHDMDVVTSALSASWRDHLLTLAPGAASTVILEQDMITMLLLHKRIPRSLVSPSAAYRSIEHKLMEQGLREAFDRWLEHALEHTVIEVTGLLQEGPPTPPVDPEKAPG